MAAAEMGMRADAFSNRLGQSAALNRTLGALRIPGGIIQRQVFLEAFGEVVQDMNLGVYMPPTKLR